VTACADRVRLRPGARGARRTGVIVGCWSRSLTGHNGSAAVAPWRRSSAGQVEKGAAHGGDVNDSSQARLVDDRQVPEAASGHELGRLADGRGRVHDGRVAVHHLEDPDVVDVLARPSRFAMAVGGITLAIRDGWGLYWSMWGLVTTMGYALIYLWLVMLGHRSSRQVHSKAYRP
jgi:hypothetical protein